MTASSGEEIKADKDNFSSVRTGIDSNFNKEKSVKAATEWTGGEEKVNSKLHKIFSTSTNVLPELLSLFRPNHRYVEVDGKTYRACNVNQECRCSSEAKNK